MIKITNTKHVTIQIAIMGVVVEMSRSLGDKIVDHFPKFLPFMKKFFEDPNASSQLKIYSLQTIQNLLERKPTDHVFTSSINDIMNMILNSVSSDHFVIVSEGLTTVPFVT